MGPDTDYDIYKDQNKFKNYVSDCTLTLQLFEKAKEWADLINCLRKMYRVLSKYDQFKEYIPEKKQLSKRLAQCCNPSLPNGVHAKVLEIYKIIFRRIGPERLACDLPIYSIGIFPLFANTSIQIKITILQIFEEFYIPLGKDLVSCLSGLHIAILPALEEINTEHYFKTLKFLDLLVEKVGKIPFYHSVWRCISSNSSVRLGALRYLMDNIPSSKSSDISVYIPKTSLIVVDALRNSLNSSAVLVKRSTLDLLLTHFVISDHIFANSDLALIIYEALKILPKNDASLNRRIVSWTSDNLEKSKASFIEALNILFKVQSSEIENVLVSIDVALVLSDYPEIINHVSDEVMDHVIDTLSVCHESPNFEDVIIKTNKFFNVMKIDLFWSHLGYRISNIENFNTTEKIELQVKVLNLLLDNIERLNKNCFNLTLIFKALIGTAKHLIFHNLTHSIKLIDLISKIWNIVKSYGFNSNTNEASETKYSSEFSLVITENIQLFEDLYHAFITNYLIPCPPYKVGTNEFEPENPDFCHVFYILSSLLVEFYFNLEINPSKDSEYIDCIRDIICILECDHIKIVLIALNTLVQFLAFGTFVHLEKTFNLTQIQNKCFKKLWSILKFYTISDRLSLVSIFLVLDGICPNICGDIMYKSMTENGVEARIEAYRNFSTLWKLTENCRSLKSFDPPIFLMLDCLNNGECEFLRLMAKSWLLYSMNKTERVLDPILSLMLDSSTEKTENSCDIEYDYRRIIYLFQVLEYLIECDKKLTLKYLINSPLSNNILGIISYRNGINGGSSNLYYKLSMKNYLEFLIVDSLRFIFTNIENTSYSEQNYSNISVQSKASRFLNFLFSSISDHSFINEWSNLIKEHILDILYKATSKDSVILQVEILSLIYTLFCKNGLDNDTTKFIVTSDLFLSTIDIGLTRNCKNFNFDFYWLNFIIVCLPYLGNNPTLPVHLLLLLSDLMINEVEENLFKIHNILNAFKCIIEYVLDISRTKSSNKKDKSSGLFQNVFKNFFPIPNFYKSIEPGNDNNNNNSTNKAKLESVINVLWKNMNALIYNLFDIWYIFKKSINDSQELIISHNAEKKIYGGIFALLVEILDLLYESSPFYFLHSILEQWNYFSENLDISLGFKCKKLLAEILKQMKINFIEFLKNLDNFSENLRINNLNEKIKKHDIAPELKVDIKNLSFISPRTFKLHYTLELNDTLYELLGLDKVDLVGQSNSKEYFNKYRKVDPILNSFYNISILEILLSVTNWSDINEETVLSSLLNLIYSSFNLNNPIIILISLMMMNNIRPYTKNLSIKRQVNNVLKRFLELFAVFFSEDLQVEQNVFWCILLVRKTKECLDIWNKFNEDNKNVVNTHFVQLTKLLFPLILSENNALSFEATILIEKIIANSLCDIKLLKRQVLDRIILESVDVFNNSSLTQMKSFVNIIGTFFDKDDSLWQEYLKLITQPYTSSALFSNQVFMASQKVQFIKILGFILFCGKKDQYLSYLPIIQEKLAETLRNRENNTDILDNVFLCFRILFLRFNDSSLRSFWPVIISEMIQIFKTTEEPEFIIPILKFIDLVSTLNIEQFNLYKWMFISDSNNPYEMQNLKFIPFVDLLFQPRAVDNEIEVLMNEFICKTSSLLIESEKIEHEPNSSSPVSSWQLLKNLLSQKKSYEHFNNAKWLNGSDYDEINNLVLKDFIQRNIQPKTAQKPESVEEKPSIINVREILQTENENNPSKPKTTPHDSDGDLYNFEMDDM